jgi:TFIIF-interacting CTD phosphatase-like protein
MRATFAPLRDSTNRHSSSRDVLSAQRQTNIIRKPATPSTVAKSVTLGSPHTEPKHALHDHDNDEINPRKSLFDSTPYLLRPLGDHEEVLLTVVLDLDETLVSNRQLDLPAAILRPYVLDALNALRKLPGVEVVLWTASTEETAAPVVRQLSARGTVFDDVIFRNDAWFTEPYHTKDLRLLGRQMDRVIVFDNAPNCCKMNPHNSVLVEDFTGYFNAADNTLINLFRIVEVVVRNISESMSVQDSLASLADEEAICRRVTFDLPEAWRRVNIAELHPLQVPPHGTFFKVQVTRF